MTSKTTAEASVRRVQSEYFLGRARRLGLMMAAGLAAALLGCGKPGGGGGEKDVELRGLESPKGFDGKQWTNSLGMKFAPVPPTSVAFCIWETRVRDYEVFATTTNADASWKPPGFPQTPDHPVVKVSWEDANAFCEWLTAKERAAGTIGNGMSYRLPTDEEWSIAVGLPAEQGRTPEEKSGEINNVFPWGTQWPPPLGAGNYEMDGVDEFQDTSPAGSFAANQSGLYDLGGNVWEWCRDEFAPGSGDRVSRGGSWGDDVRVRLLSSYRDFSFPGHRGSSGGFRCVLVVSGG